MTDAVTNTPLQVTIHPQQYAQQGQSNFWGGDGNTPGFQDFLDTINPLQHIPIVSNIYQAITGDKPSIGSKLAGDTLFGGPIGFLASLFGSMVESASGSDITGNVVAAIEGKPVPMLHTATQTKTASDLPQDFLSPSKRAAYNAYVNANLLG